MKANSPAQKYKKLELKLSQIQARKVLFENKIRNQERKADTRRKILIGAWAIDKAQKENRLDELYKMVSAYLTKDIDKKLF
jgi:hypothetical protein